MYTLIVDRRDNTFFCGLSGWSKLEENALWYGADSIHDESELKVVLAHLASENGDHFYTVSRG